jgi:hypothetical protein
LLLPLLELKLVLLVLGSCSCLLLLPLLKLVLVVVLVGSCS